MASFDEVHAIFEKHRQVFGSDYVATFIGEDPRIVAAREKVRAIERMPPGTRPPPLLISGEPGTGKMNLVSLFRHVGPRRDRGMADSPSLGGHVIRAADLSLSPGNVGM